MASLAAARRSERHSVGSSGSFTSPARAQSRNRINAQIQRKEQEKVIKDLYAHATGSQTKTLQGPELRDFMEQYVRQLPGHEERVVTNEEVMYVLKVADTLGTGEIGASELTTAVATWQSLLASQEMIDSRFELYDRDSTGTLSRLQVGELLKDLNGGVSVSADEVDWVIQKADGKAEGVLDGRVDRNELRVALAVWYTMQEKKRKETALSCCCGGRGPVEVDRRAGSYIPLSVTSSRASSNLEVKVETRRGESGQLEVAVAVVGEAETEATEGP